MSIAKECPPWKCLQQLKMVGCQWRWWRCLILWLSNSPKLDLKSQKDLSSRKKQGQTVPNLLRVIFHTGLFLRRAHWARKWKERILTLQRRNLSEIFRQMDCPRKEENWKSHWSYTFAINATLTQKARRCLKATICTNIRNGGPSVISVIKGFLQMNICKTTFSESTILQLTAVLLVILKQEQKGSWYCTCRGIIMRNTSSVPNALMFAPMLVFYKCTLEETIRTKHSGLSASGQNATTPLGQRKMWRTTIKKCMKASDTSAISVLRRLQFGQTCTPTNWTFTKTCWKVTIVQKQPLELALTQDIHFKKLTVEHSCSYCNTKISGWTDHTVIHILHSIRDCFWGDGGSAFSGIWFPSFWECFPRNHSDRSWMEKKTYNAIGRYNSQENL